MSAGLIVLGCALSFDSAFGLAQDSPERAERVEGLPIAAYASVDHTAWDALLKRHVVSGLVPPPGAAAKGGSAHSAGPFRPATDGGMVDYEGLQQDRATLDRYVASLQDVQPSQLGSREAQLAFWINAYNANVVKGVLDHYPLASVKEVKGFFDRIRYRVGGRELTLNEIEGEGRALGDWRIHFAVVCASSSCPLLRAEAYTAERLEAQLAEQTKQFLADPQRGLRVEGRTLRLSKIFDWYKADFIPPPGGDRRRRSGSRSDPAFGQPPGGGIIPASKLGWFARLTPEKLLARLEPYLDRPVAQAIRSKRLSINFLDYDWSLNAQHQ